MEWPLSATCTSPYVFGSWNDLYALKPRNIIEGALSMINNTVEFFFFDRANFVGVNYIKKLARFLLSRPHLH